MGKHAHTRIHVLIYMIYIAFNYSWFSELIGFYLKSISALQCKWYSKFKQQPKKKDIKQWQQNNEKNNCYVMKPRSHTHINIEHIVEFKWIPGIKAHNTKQIATQCVWNKHTWASHFSTHTHTYIINTMLVFYLNRTLRR